MVDIVFSSCHLQDQDAACEFFGMHRCMINSVAGVDNRFEYATEMCRLDSTTVNLSRSSTGWSYVKRSEADGFLLTIPDIGIATWKSPEGKHESRGGTVVISDQRKVGHFSYSPLAQYISIFLDDHELLRFIATLNGVEKRSRVCFKHVTASPQVGKPLTDIARIILSSSSILRKGENLFLDYLKESLFCFALYNIENNYSQLIRSEVGIRALTPHSIKSTVDFIQVNFANALTVGSLALRAGVSIRGLQAGFKKYIGVTVIGYIREVRLKNAKAMLCDKSLLLTPKQVSELCGFSNYYVFCKYYQARFAESPIATMQSLKQDFYISNF